MTSPGSRKSHDLTGDMFVNAFNTGGYSGDRFSVSSDTTARFARSDTVVSSPEETADGSQDQANGGSNSEPKLNPRSCVTCRKRKVRCDKREPCSNCVKGNIECVFPPPGRAPRKPRRPHDAELLKRLRRLESVVDSLGAQVDEDGNAHPADHGQERRSASEGANLGELSPTAPSRKTSLEYGLGRLLIKEGRSRYVSNEFWSSLGEEIAEIRNVLDSPSSDEEEEALTPENANDPANRYAHHQGFVFGYSSLMFDMSKLHPSPSQIFIVWEIFKEHVDPVLKILHVPTVKNVIMKAAVSNASLSKASEALFYSICFASVVSMSDDQCRQLLGDDKDKLMQRYRFAVEQGLARASFLNSSNLVVLQAFVMFLTVVKYIDTSRGIWSLAGLAMQQAQAQGLHRDPTNFNLNPFETEMRRRLWWHISLQDARAAEDHGADPNFHEHLYDTKLPLNINDEEIWPEMTETPQEHQGATEMTFSLLRIELGNIQRKLRVMASVENDDDKKRTIKEKENLIDLTHRHMQEKYFSHCDQNNPILWVASTVGKLILAKMWLFVHHPRLYQEDTKIANNLKEQVFMTSVEVVEFGILLQRGKHTAKWSWLFKTYMQWHAVAYVLSELSHMPPGPDFDRAWNAVDSVYDKRMIAAQKGQRGVLWRPLMQLYERAKARRDTGGGQSTASPHSNAESYHTSSSDSQILPSSGYGMMTDNWLGANPYNNAVTAVGGDFGFDFNDPMFNEVNFTPMLDPNIFPSTTAQQTGTKSAPVNSLPFGFTPDIDGYLSAFGAQTQQPTWQPQMQQQWH